MSFNAFVVSTTIPVPVDVSAPVVESVSPPGPSKVIFLIRVETVKFEDVRVVPTPFVTLIGPVVADAGTTAVIWPSLTKVKLAPVPLKVTAVVPVKFAPFKVTVVPGMPSNGVKEVNDGGTEPNGGTTVNGNPLLGCPPTVTMMGFDPCETEGTVA